MPAATNADGYKPTPMVPIPPKGEEKLIEMSYLNKVSVVRYQPENKDTSITIEAGSTLPLMETSSRDLDIGDDYDPFANRKVEHPTTDWETFIHLLKGSLGSGILAMPNAIKNSGLIFGTVATFLIGAICTYCITVLVRTSNELCRRLRYPSLGYAETAEMAFVSSPNSTIRKYCRLAKAIVNIFLVLDLLGCCCVYILFVSKNIKQVIDYYTGTNYDLRFYMLCLLPLLLPLNMIRNLKMLAPFSLAANVLIFIGMLITFSFMCIDLPPLYERKYITEITKQPSFFGTVIFALEGIGVVMPLENNMRNPNHFLGCPGVLNFGMSFVVGLYAMCGFLGYAKYGEFTEDSITLNLPQNSLLAQSVKLMIAVAILLTYTLQFHVPMEIIWNNVKSKVPSEYSSMSEYTLRVILVTGTVVLAILLPNLGPFITLIGAVCLSTLGLMFPAILELIVFWHHPSYENKIMWKIRNYLIICFGFVGFITGTLVSITEFQHQGV